MDKVKAIDRDNIGLRLKKTNQKGHKSKDKIENWRNLIESLERNYRLPKGKAKR